MNVRRLWPDLHADRSELFNLPAGQAEAAVAAGLVFPMLSPAAEPTAVGPLATMIRNRLERDAELAGLLATATAYARRTRNIGLLRYLASMLPRQLRPSDFTPGRFRAEHGEPPADGWYSRPPQWSAGVRDPRASCLAQHIDRRETSC